MNSNYFNGKCQSKKEYSIKLTLTFLFPLINNITFEMVCLIDHTVCKEAFSLVDVNFFLFCTSNYTKLWALTIFKFNNFVDKNSCGMHILFINAYFCGMHI